MNKKLNVLLLGFSERVTYIIELLLLSNKNINNVSVVHNIVWAKEVLNTKNTDVIILDSKFSDNEGLVFFTGVKKISPSIRTIILTNYTDNFHNSYAKKIGIDYLIDKSMAYKELSKILSKINSTSL